MKKCLRCSGDLVPGEEWPQDYQDYRIYYHKKCNQKQARGAAGTRRSIELGEGINRAQYSALSNEEQKRLRAKYGKEHNKQDTTPPEPKRPKARTIGSSTFRTRLVSSWDDTAVSRNIRHNLRLKHGVCEIIGAHFDFCHAMHILSRKRCRDGGHPEWADDEENCVLAMSGFNSGMERGEDRAYWVDPFNGRFMPPIGKDYDGWLLTLAVPARRIQMYGRRPWYALMAMTGEYVEPFSAGEFVDKGVNNG